MSIHTVQITPAEEQYAPPSEIIELAVVGDDTDQIVHSEDAEQGRSYYQLRRPRKLVILTLLDYEETSESSTLKRKVEFPAIDLNDLLRALSSFGVGVQSFHVGEPPVRLPAPPAPEEVAS